MKKNLFFLAAVPFVALLAGCPNGGNGVEGEGEGDAGEGEGEPFSATIDMTFTNPISSVVVNGAEDPCANLMVHEYAVDVADFYDIKPTPSDTNRRCVAKGVDVSDPGAYELHWSTDADGNPTKGDCGTFPNGAYVDQTEGTVVNVTTDDSSIRLLISGDAFFPPFDLVVTDGTFYGEGPNFVSSGTISDDLCTITIHQVGSGGLAGDFVLLSERADCGG
jgi:hypothetical protein